MHWYILTLDAHELYGPFAHQQMAHEYAYRKGLRSYCLEEESKLKPHQFESHRPL